MAPFFYIPILLFALVAISFAEVVSLRSAPGRSQALVERQQSPTEYQFRPPSAKGDPEFASDLDLLDIVLVASVDGNFHALNRSSGHTIWSMSSFPSSTRVSAPSALGPLIGTNHVDHDQDLTDDNAHHELYIIEPQSGDIYVMATPSSPLQPFPFSMSELVDMSPFSFSGDDDRRVFVGRKETSLLLVELETGKVKATLNSECPWDPFEDLNDRNMEVDLDELEGNKPQSSSLTEVFIGRTDYHISIYTRPFYHNSVTARPPVQNLSFSRYGPNNRDSHFQASYRRTKDNAYIQSLPNGEIISFKAKMNGDSTQGHDSQLLWGHTFNNPIVAIFDVFRKHSSHPQYPFVLLQPRPRLQDVLPNLTPDTATAKLPNLDSAYVGIVQETGSLFAMSPARFPLVVFGGVNRYTKGRLIDAPDNADNHALPDVDVITRLQKSEGVLEIKQQATCDEGMKADRSCLVGVRRLEDGDGHESRMRRLLDGPTDGRFPALQPEGENVRLAETLPMSTNASGSLIASTETDLKSGAAVKMNFWKALVVTLLLGIPSLWFGLKRLKGPGTEKRLSVEDGYVAGKSLDFAAKDLAIRQNAIQMSGTLVLESLVDVKSVSVEASPQPPNDTTAADEAEESDREGDVEGDAPNTPGKRKSRRGKRGKKKRVAIVVSGVAQEDGNGFNGSENVGVTGSSDSQDVDSSLPSSLLVPSPEQPSATPSLVVSDTILGYGSHGTVVFQGSLQGRAVAVKRLLQDFVTLASSEVSILQESDDHPNVIRYYYQEAHANFLYIALELCPASLADIIENPDRDQWRDVVISFDPKKALKQITSGLRHLHALKLVHRDIKPQNILVSTTKTPVGSEGKTSYRMLISDFGLCKKLDIDQTSFLPTAHGAMASGTVGWRAPEILRGEVKLDESGDDHSVSSQDSVGTDSRVPTTGTGKPARLTKSVDIFSLGCLFYYTLSSGGHPFGDRFEREGNILKNTKSLDRLERFGEEGSEAIDLINSMLNPEPYERPDTTTCLLHPFFWDAGRRLNFLQDASDRFEIMCRDPKDAYLFILEKDAFKVVGNDWHSRLDRVLVENLGKFRKYDGHSVQDLLRALRNKKHHYQDMPDNVKRHLGAMPEGYLSYFTRRYPHLFLHVHHIIGITELRREPMFRTYFEFPD